MGGAAGGSEAGGRSLDAGFSSLFSGSSWIFSSDHECGRGGHGLVVDRVLVVYT
ncbi:hypothetical protein FH972_019510 [Carpinus fangiana]|uniref:Uncharacterized protein n=1 Tax=Carpinus fangiana TaxID=176857 RepID=A0A5N6RTV9_9ROSI|nr:hypothetical protein FH972_019510 [Carpinus fangiana]